MDDAWPRVRLRDLCESVDYGLTASASTSPVGPKFLRITDIVRGTIDWSSVPYVKASVAERTRYALHPRDIVIARTGATTGYSACILNPPDAIFASYLVRFTVLPEYDARFVSYALKAPEWWNYISAVLGDKSAQPNASARTLGDAWLTVPGLAQQQAIAEVLGALDDKIEANRRVEVTSWALAAAHFEHLIARPKDSVLLSSLLALAYGKALPAGSRVFGEIPVYGSGGVVGWHNKPLVSGPGIIVGRKGTAGSVHWCADSFFPIDTTFYVDKTSVPLIFAYYVLLSLGLDHMNADSAVPGLNRNTALSQRVPLPGRDDLASFSGLAETLVDRATAAAAENRVIGAIRDTLLPKLLSGELRVRDAGQLAEEAI